MSVALVAALLTDGPTEAATAALPAVPAVPADPTTLVNPFIGTQNFGNTCPGASAPFGMVQVSPDTGGQGGYDYQQDRIYGFSQTHLSGVGCGVMGELPMMPTTGAVDSVDPNAYRSTYAHEDEHATPGYYQVRLSTYDINAELTATPRSGWQRYTFPATDAANVLFNTGKANQGVFGVRRRPQRPRPVRPALGGTVRLSRRRPAAQRTRPTDRDPLTAPAPSSTTHHGEACTT